MCMPKVWKQLNRADIAAARCTIGRLMKLQGLRGAIRGKRVRTTTPDTSAPRPLDRGNRQFKAERPNQLWVSDFTYVSAELGYMAFVNPLEPLGYIPPLRLRQTTTGNSEMPLTCLLRPVSTPPQSARH